MAAVAPWAYTLTIPVLTPDSATMASTDLTKKHPSGNLHQISNTEWWYHNVQFGGNVLFRR